MVMMTWQNYSKRRYVQCVVLWISFFFIYLDGNIAQEILSLIATVHSSGRSNYHYFELLVYQYQRMTQPSRASLTPILLIY